MISVPFVGGPWNGRTISVPLDQFEQGKPAMMVMVPEPWTGGAAYRRDEATGVTVPRAACRYRRQERGWPGEPLEFRYVYEGREQ